MTHVYLCTLLRHAGFNAEKTDQEIRSSQCQFFSQYQAKSVSMWQKANFKLSPCRLPKKIEVEVTSRQVN